MGGKSSKINTVLGVVGGGVLAISGIYGIDYACTNEKDQTLVAKTNQIFKKAQISVGLRKATWKDKAEEKAEKAFKKVGEYVDEFLEEEEPYTQFKLPHFNEVGETFTRNVNKIVEKLEHNGQRKETFSNSSKAKRVEEKENLLNKKHKENAPKRQADNQRIREKYNGLQTGKNAQNIREKWPQPSSSLLSKY